jgi:hypothetical protein
MTPPGIVQRACAEGLHLIAVCDHNSAENVRATQRAAQGTPLAVIGGIEVCAREEAHVLGLFADLSPLLRAQKAVYAGLKGRNRPGTFGEQQVMDERGQLLRRNARLLIGATDLSLAEAVAMIHRLGGLAIAAHVDRPSFSVISQLGFIPANLELDGAEVCSDRQAAVPPGLPVIRSSDAHRLDEIGSRRTRFLVEQPTAQEVGMALRQVGGRRIESLSH